MSRRLLNRPSGRSTTVAAATPARSLDPSLPEYEPLACPIDDTSRRALSDLSSELRAPGNYDAELKSCAGFLETSVGDLHERLNESKTRLATIQQTRAKLGDDQEPSAQEEVWTAHLRDLQNEVDTLTLASEAALRHIIDAQAEFEEEANTLRDLPALVIARRAAATRAQAGQEEEEEEEEEPAPVSVAHTVREQRARRQAEYERMSMHQRYALNNHYAGFKKVWHDAVVGGDGRPLPDAARWFRDGEPVMAATDEGSDDDDFVMQREVLSVNCPLTLRPMKEPFRNKKCPHVFEREAIHGYLAEGNTVCPQTGCSQTFSARSFDRDFQLDTAMVRQIERSRQQESSEEEDEDDVGDASLVEMDSRKARIKRAKQEREEE